MVVTHMIELCLQNTELQAIVSLCSAASFIAWPQNGLNQEVFDDPWFVVLPM